MPIPIIYSDATLPVKDFGNNSKRSLISDVSKYSLQRCLKEIEKANPDVVFHSAQYCQNTQTVYIYANKFISTKDWEESQFAEYKPLSNRKEILEEIKKILTEEAPKDIDCISLYDIANLIKESKEEYGSIREKYRRYFSQVLSEKDKDSRVRAPSFDYDKKQLQIEFRYRSDNYNKIIFAKQNEDLYVLKSTSTYSQLILTLIGKELSELYDELMKFSSLTGLKKDGIKSSNSNFLVGLKYNGIDVSNEYSKDFKLSYDILNDYNCNYYGYDYKCNSVSVLTALQGNENEIFKKIFVRIDDCPEWSKSALYQIRKEQLVEQQLAAQQLVEQQLAAQQLKEEKKLEEEQLHKEPIKQKRLEFKRIVFPWAKK